MLGLYVQFDNLMLDTTTICSNRLFVFEFELLVYLLASSIRVSVVRLTYLLFDLSVLNFDTDNAPYVCAIGI